MHDPGAPLRPERVPLDPEDYSMLRALLLCELIEQIDHAAATSHAQLARTNRRELVPALHKMAEIRNALDRLDDGSYGVCDTCHRQVGFADLKAVPARRTCGACRPAPTVTWIADAIKAHHVRRTRRDRHNEGFE